MATAGGQLRAARVGDRLPSSLIRRERARRIDATAVVLPGAGPIGPYLDELKAFRESFAAWDGRVRIAEPDGEVAHRLLVVDRYHQVHQVADGASVDQLPRARELEQWFRHLATMCPECGVPDEPLGRGWTP
ncbi:MAG: hypothetical protein ACRDGV_02625 [Candidatus Limnocylindria bacterium]